MEPATIRLEVVEWCRRILCDGASPREVNSFLASPEFYGFACGVESSPDMSYCECEGDFDALWGDALKQLYQQWQNRRVDKRERRFCASIPEANIKLKYDAEFFSVIPVDWIPSEAERAEVQRFLHYLENAMHEVVDRFFRALWGRGLPFTESSRVELYDALTETECVEPKAVQIINDDLKKQRNCGEGAILIHPDTFLERSKYERVPELYTISDYESFLLGYSENIFTPAIVVDEQGLLAEDAECIMLAFSKQACKQCRSCFLMTQILRLLNVFHELLRFWSYTDICHWVFCGIPLPPRAGVAHWGFQGKCDPYMAFAPELTFFSVGESKEPPPTPDDLYTQQLQVFAAQMEKLAVPYPSVCGLRLLPFLSAQSAAAIWSRYVPQADARTYALHLHMSPDEPGKQSGRLRRGELRAALERWNRIAPAEWTYTSEHAHEVFCRAVKNAQERLAVI